MKCVGTYVKFKIDGLYKGEGIIIGIDYIKYGKYLIEYYNVILLKPCDKHKPTDVVKIFDEEITFYN